MKVLKNIVIYSVMALHNNEQSDLTNRINQDKKLDDLPTFKYVHLFFSLLFRLGTQLPCLLLPGLS